MRERESSRCASGDVPGIQAGISNVESVQQIGDESLEAETIAAVGSRAEESLVSVPVVLRGVNLLALEAFHHLIVVPHPHGAADDFTDTRKQNIDRFRQSGILGASLHVERLDLDRESTKHNRFVDHIGHLPFGHLGNIIAKLEVGSILLLDLVLSAELDGVLVVHSLHRLGGRLEVGVEVVEDLLADRVGEHSLDDVDDQVFDRVEKIVEGDEYSFGFDVSVFREMATGSGSFSTVGLRNAVSIAKGRQDSLEIELGRLGEVSL